MLLAAVAIAVAFTAVAIAVAISSITATTLVVGSPMARKSRSILV